MHSVSKERTPESLRAMPQPAPCDVAIVGMSCLLPKAPGIREFWANVIHKVHAITEVPKDRFNADLYFDPDRKARDKIYSRWGGFLDEVPFDPMRYGIPPNALASIDPMQLLSLVVVDQALNDAGYGDRDFPRENTSVIFGLSGGLGDLGIRYAVRSSLTQFLGQPPEKLLEQLPEWTEDSFAGILLNVAAGRVANRFNLGGVNFTVDAACASSLAAVYLAARELTLGASDMVIVGGVDTVQSPFGYLCFSKSQALSPRGRCRAFDESADGIAISEGVTVLVLKRLQDAERDGDRIYAVIKGVAGSSDGRGRSMTAPRLEGQTLALRRAYAQAGIRPSTVGLIEAHGTGTAAGDATELAALSEVFQADGARPQSCGIGAVKSMVGHTKSAAGVTGLMKVALALHHKVLPPTLHVEQPNPKLREPASPFFVNTEPQPWVASGSSPRRAGVSSFGFGGTNFHAVLEEYQDDCADPVDRANTDEWPAELFFWNAASPAALNASLEELAGSLQRGVRPALRDLARTICRGSGAPRAGGMRLAIVASSLEDLQAKLAIVKSALSAGQEKLEDPQGVYLAPAGPRGKTAFLFPGQGSQKPGMLRDLALHFPEIRQSLERAEDVLAGRLPKKLSAYIYPPPAFSPDEERQQMQEITDTVVAQPALGAVEMALDRLLKRLGVEPDMTAGHSYGEYVALCAAGVFADTTLFDLSESRGRAIRESVGGDAGTMAAVQADADAVARALEDAPEITIANHNSPRQTVISGTTAAVGAAISQLEAAGLAARLIPVACAFHSPLMQPARDRLAAVLSRQTFSAPRAAVFSNTLGGRYSEEPREIAEVLTDHLVKPVRFVQEILSMYEQGARLFVEVGPKGVLTSLARQILEGREARFIQIDGDRHGLVQLLQGLAQLAVAGAKLELDQLFRGRAAQLLDLGQLEMNEAPQPGWLVNGSRVFPRSQRPALSQPVNLVSASDAQPRSAPDSAAPAGPVIPAPAVEVVRHSPGPPPAMAGNLDAVMLQFQQLMAQFLQTQAAVMTSYLGALSTTPPAAVEMLLPAMIPAAALHPPVASVTAAPPPMPVATPPAPAPPAPRSSEAGTQAPPRDYTAELRKIAGERTGYPVEMLDLDAGIEPDLGIDSIKRVEILSAFQRLCSASEQTQVQGVMEKLTSARTLREIADRLTATLSQTMPVNGSQPHQAEALQPTAARGARDYTAELRKIASERTGYPAEMLDLDAGIEADLGIDSIKRVEILSAFQRLCSASEQTQVQGVMEKLTSARTLREIADRLVDVLGNGSQAKPGQPPAPLTRCVLTTAAKPRRQAKPQYYPGRVSLLTDDETGVAAALAEELNRAGERALLLRHSPDAVIATDGVFSTDLTNPAAIGSVVETIRQQHGAIGAVIHLLPLRPSQPPSQCSLDEWRELVAQDVKSLYALARATEADLKQTGRAGGALFAAITARGGDFGLRPNTATAPTHCAVADFTKTLALEFTGVLAKVVDLDPLDPVPILRQKLIDELTSNDETLQVGLPGDRRLTVIPQLAPLGAETVRRIGRDWVFLLTGGARGITGEIAIRLAEQYQPTLILAGTSRLPSGDEPPETAGVSEAARLKAALTARLRAAAGNVKPAEVEAAYQRLLKNREIRRTLEEMRRHGARVEYHAVDVREEAAFSGLLDQVYSRHGRLDVVIHGAGIIEDKLIRDKTPESFDRVVHTKADSAFLLSRKLRPESLQCLLFMSSISAAFGNRGQADYASANGVMNGLAVVLAAQWPGRVVAMNWGPWDQAGMVSEETRQQFLTRGVRMIPPAAGAEAVLREIEAGRQEEPLVALGDGPWTEAAAPAATPLVRTVHALGSAG